MVDASDIGRMMNTFRCQRCDMPADICKGCVEKIEAELKAANLQLGEVTAHRDRLRDMLNEIRGMAYRDVFSSEPSNFAALVLKIVEDGYTEKRVLEPQKIVHCEGVYCLGSDKCQCKCDACIRIVNF